MRTRRPWKAGAIALTLMILLSATSSAGTRWGASFSTLSGGKMIAGGIAQAFAPEAMAAGGPGGMEARTLAAPKPDDGGCFPEGCTGVALQGIGDVTGVGNASGGVIVLKTTAIPLVTCFNNAENPGNSVVGINQPLKELEAQDPFLPSDVGRNGRVSFVTVTSTEEIGEPLPGPATDYGCPNDNTWTAAITSYRFLSATLFAFSDSGDLIGQSDPYKFNES